MKAINIKEMLTQSAKCLDCQKNSSQWQYEKCMNSSVDFAVLSLEAGTQVTAPVYFDQSTRLLFPQLIGQVRN